MSGIGVEKMSELTFDEAMAFIEDPFNAVPEKETFTDEQAKLNSQFWAIVGEIGLDKPECELLKKYFYKMYQVESMHDFTVDDWDKAISNLKDFQDNDPEALRNMLITMKDSL